ncbi:MAG TPA: hypothetical protein VGM51_18800 [Armatimonadota bacterium]|jgi:hypothetical protein
MSVFRPLGFVLASLLFFPVLARGQTPWEGAGYMNRLPLTMKSYSGHNYAQGEVVAASISEFVVAGRIRTDGADAVVYYNGAPIPSRALVMGGTTKVLFPLQAPLPERSQQAGYTLYFNGLTGVTAPPLPAGVQGWDFSDGSLHGWKSLQDPGGSADVNITADETYGNALTMDNSLYHHPIAFASTMTPQAEGTVYTKLRTGGGEEEAAAFQRFTTQTLTDTGNVPYLTGGNVAGTGLAVDAFGSQQMLVTVGLGSPEGASQRIHPGPGALDPGTPYVASSNNFQYMVTATLEIDGVTAVLGDAWQAPVDSRQGGADPSPFGFAGGYRATSANESQQPLNAGVVGIMSYYSTLKLHWMYAVPSGWAEALETVPGTVETADGPGRGLAIVQGITYYQPNGKASPVGGLTVTIRDSSNAVLASGVSGLNGEYKLIVTAGATASTINVTAAQKGINGSASASVKENGIIALDIPVIFTSHVSGRVTDAAGAPVQGAAVGRALDGLPWVFTDSDGRYTLPVPVGTRVIGAHKDGMYLSGPQWVPSISANFTLLPATTNLLAGRTPAFSPVASEGTGVAGLNDGDLSTNWTSGAVETISDANPLRLTYTLDNATVSEVDVHWKHYPAAWRIEMTNSGGTRTYYQAGGTSANERGGFIAPGTTDRHVIAVKTAAVTDVTSISIVVTAVSDTTPVSAYEIIARPDNATTVADVATAMRIAVGFQAAPIDNNAFYRWNARNDDATINVLDAVELVKDLNREVKPLRVFVINYQPVIEAEGSRTVGQIFGWFNPYANTEAHRADMELASHDYLRINLLPQASVDEYPIFTNGYRFTDSSFTTAWRTRTFPPGHCDENAIIKEFDLVRRVDCGDIDEIWVQAPPGFAMWETTMAGPGAYFCNSGPVSGTNGNRLFIMTFFNYERSNDVMLEDWGHRTESILGFHVYGSWDSASERTTWDRFTRYDKNSPGRASCGNVHYPPNGTSDYDFANTTLVSSDADDWLNYPNFTGTRTMVNRENWAAPFYGDYHRNYHIWWFQRMPHIPGIGPDGMQANWWKYIVDLNSYPESR